MSQDHKYTAADFERYHSGKMSAGEMHALEKAALEDPFLADALDGYAYSASPVKDIDELKQKLFAKKKRKNILVVMQNEKAWLRIAALFILIAGIGYLAYQLSFTEKSNMLATKQDSVLKNAAEQSITAKPDSSLVNEKDAIASSEPAKNKEGFMDANEKGKPRDMKISGDEPDERSSANAIQGSLQKSIKSNAQRDVSFMQDKNILKGRVVDSVGNPVGYATISAKDKNIVTRADSAGRYQLFAKDSSLMATVSASGYKTKQKKLSDKSEQVIVIENDSKALNEVVVTAPAMQKQRKAVSTRLENQVSGISVIKSASEPVNGLQKFNEYIKKNIRIPADTEGKSYKGNIVLSFEINKKGNPKKIKVERSLCDLCDKEAIRLLMQGPKWKYIKDHRQVVTIEF